MSHTSKSQIPALGPFTRRLRRYWLGIVNRVRWPMHTGELEGINNKIKVIKRMACGYRDSEYIFLKIQAAIPVIREEPKKRRRFRRLWQNWRSGRDSNPRPPA